MSTGDDRETPEDGLPEFGMPMRSEFILESGITFLNHGSYGATPKRVLAFSEAWRERMEKQPVRFMTQELPLVLRGALRDLGAFVGGEPERMSFVDNATTGVNAVLRSIALASGDRVVTTSHVYPAVRNALEFVCRRAEATLVEVDLPFPCSGPAEVLERFDAALKKGARLALIDHVTSASALVMPVAEMVGLCRERGIPVMVDGAHAIGMLPLDLEALGATWYTANAHKWLFAPKSCAILHASEEGWETLRPTVISHVPEGPEAFDWPGTRDFSAWLAVTESLAFVRELGVDAIRAHNGELARWAARHLSETWEVDLPAPLEMLGSMACVSPPGNWKGTDEEARLLHAQLWDDYKIEVPVFPFEGKIWVRISAQIYNRKLEYRCLSEALVA